MLAILSKNRQSLLLANISSYTVFGFLNHARAAQLLSYSDQDNSSLGCL